MFEFQSKNIISEVQNNVHRSLFSFSVTFVKYSFHAKPSPGSWECMG